MIQLNSDTSESGLIICIYIYLYLFMHSYTYRCILLYMYVYTCIHTCMNFSVSVFVFEVLQVQNPASSHKTFHHGCLEQPITVHLHFPHTYSKLFLIKTVPHWYVYWKIGIVLEFDVQNITFNVSHSDMWHIKMLCFAHQIQKHSDVWFENFFKEQMWLLVELCLTSFVLP